MAVVTRASNEGAGRLIIAAAAGDEDAFVTIVGDNHEDMRRVCLVVCGDAALADEAVQAAWSIAWRKLASVRDPARLRPWLVSIAVNELRQLIRSSRRRTVMEANVADQDASSNDRSDPGLGVAAIDLRNALARLDPDDRALIAMRYIAGFDANELALATGRSASGTRGRLSRLLDRLEKELQNG